MAKLVEFRRGAEAEIALEQAGIGEVSRTRLNSQILSPLNHFLANGP